ncbi:MAG: hypothetical protein ACTSQJ_13270 [Promethearchaeota archaeon]
MGFKDKIKEKLKETVATKIGEGLAKATGSKALGNIVSKGLGGKNVKSKEKGSKISQKAKIKADNAKFTGQTIKEIKKKEKILKKEIKMEYERKKQPKTGAGLDMFEKKMTKEELEKEKLRKKLLKQAYKDKKMQDLKRKQAERILDKDFVERRLSFERRRDEKREAARDGKIAAITAEILADEKETFACKVCGEEIGLGNITCPRCGSLYCMYCGFKMPDGEDFTGKCPKCGGFQNFTPAKLIQTRVEDIPEEERFWEGLSECPKCGAAIQPDWDSCVICGAKLEKKVQVSAKPQQERSISAIKEQRKKELMKRRQKVTGPKRGI